MSLSTHVLDTSTGLPAAGMCVTISDGSGEPLWERVTDEDGRTEPIPLSSEGIFEIAFETGPYFAATGRPCFYPYVSVRFEIIEAGAHHHVPLLVSPYGYSTYRGS